MVDLKAKNYVLNFHEIETYVDELTIESKKNEIPFMFYRLSEDRVIFNDSWFNSMLFSELNSQGHLKSLGFTRKNKERCLSYALIGDYNRQNNEKFNYVGLSLRIKVFQRDGFKCCYCNRSRVDGVKLEVDHIHPVSKGGKSNISNLQTLCFDCNRGKRDSIITT